MNHLNNEPKLSQAMTKLAADTLTNRLIWQPTNNLQEQAIFSRLKKRHASMLIDDLVRSYYSASSEQGISLTLTTNQAILAFHHQADFSLITSYVIDQADFYRIENAIQKQSDAADSALDQFLNN